jgi:translation elongation factor EF-4
LSSWLPRYIAHGCVPSTIGRRVRCPGHHYRAHRPIPRYAFTTLLGQLLMRAAVVYRDRTVTVSNPTEFPDVTDTSTRLVEVREPVVKATIIVPEGRISCHSSVLHYLGEMMDLCYAHRSGEIEYKYLDSSGESSRIILNCVLPLSEIVTDFFDQLKSRSSGFASFEYGVAHIHWCRMLTIISATRMRDINPVILRRSGRC